MTGNSERSDVDAAAWLEQTRAWAEASIAAFLDGARLGPPALEEAIRYALLGGGKRIRPALVRLVSDATGGGVEATAAAAVAVECIHTYSLVHDDLPAMDDDDLRRGRPTVHRAFDEATAVLVGDALQSLAFESLSEVRDGACAGRMVAALARAAGPAGMVGGQVLDLAGEGRDLGADDVRSIHWTKSAALLGASAELGALAGPAGGDSGSGSASDARAFGTALGMCFQAMDDVLDVTGDAATLGKTPGKDEGAGKGTLVAALGLDGARHEAAKAASEARSAAAALGLGALGTGLVDLLLERNS